MTRAWTTGSCRLSYALRNNLDLHGRRFGRVIATAIDDALGIRMRPIPFTLEKVLAGLKSV